MEAVSPLGGSGSMLADGVLKNLVLLGPVQTPYFT